MQDHATLLRAKLRPLAKFFARPLVSRRVTLLAGVALLPLAVAACASEAPAGDNVDLTPLDNHAAPADECPRADGTDCK